jgi:hypothetical protein
MDLRYLIVVPNHWGPVYHLEYDDHRAWRPDIARFFWTIEEAVSFAQQHGCEPHAPLQLPATAA